MTVSLKMLLLFPWDGTEPINSSQTDRHLELHKNVCSEEKKKSSYYTAQYNRSWQLPPEFCCTGKSLGWWQDPPKGAKIWHQCIVFHGHLLFFIVKHEAAPPLTPYRGFLMGISWGGFSRPEWKSHNVFGSGVPQTKRESTGNTSQTAPSLGPTRGPLQMALFIWWSTLPFAWQNW